MKSLSLFFFFLSAGWSGGRFDNDRVILISSTLLLGAWDIAYGKRKWTSTPWDLPLAALAFWSVPVGIFSVCWDKSFSAGLVPISAMVFFYLAFRNWDQRHQKYFLLGLWTMGLLTAAELLLLDGSSLKIMVLPNNINYSAAFLASFFVMLLAGVLWETPFWKSEKKAKYIIACSLLLAGAAILKTQSRGALVAVAVVGAGLIILRFRWKGFWGLLAVTALLGVFVPKETWLALSKLKDPLSLERLTIWKVAWKILSSFPLLGTGPGNFQWGYEKFALPVQKTLVSFGKTTHHAHSEPLQWACEWGLPGLSFVLWGFLRLGRRFRQQWENHRALVVPLSGLATLAVQSCFDLIFLLPFLQLLAAGLAALSLGSAKQEPWPSGPGRQALAVSLAAVAILFSFRSAGEALARSGRPYAASLFYPWNPDVILQAAQKRLEKFSLQKDRHSLETAEKTLRRAQSLAPQDPVILNFLGHFLHQVRAPLAKHPSEALAEALYFYQAAVRQAPSNVFLRMDLALFYISQKDFLLAQETLNQILRCEPHYWQAYNLLGTVLRQWEKFKLAEITWSQLLKLHGTRDSWIPPTPTSYESSILFLDRASVYNNLSGLFFETKQYDKAKNALAKALQLDPHNPLYRKNEMRLRSVVKSSGKKIHGAK